MGAGVAAALSPTSRVGIRVPGRRYLDGDTLVLQDAGEAIDALRAAGGKTFAFADRPVVRTATGGGRAGNAGARGCASPQAPKNTLHSQNLNPA